MACAETLEIDSRKHYRLSKAIFASELYLVRHDETIKPDIAAAIDEASPDDEVQGFALGDIRGVFTLSSPL